MNTIGFTSKPGYLILIFMIFLPACADKYDDLRLHLKELGAVYSKAELKKMKELDLSELERRPGKEQPRYINLKLVALLTELEVLKIPYMHKLGNEDISHLARLKNLSVLDVSAAKNMTDAGLCHLMFLQNIRELNLTAVRIHNMGTKCMRRLKKLEVLNLDATFVGDEGISRIATLPSIRVLNLANLVSVTDRGIAYIAEMRRLKKLDLTRTRITDAGVRILAGSPHLRENMRELSLVDVAITDRAITHILRFKNLEILDISQTKITLSAALRLRGLKKLKDLNVQSTPIREKDVPSLKKAMPGVKIYYSEDF